MAVMYLEDTLQEGMLLFFTDYNGKLYIYTDGDYANLGGWRFVFGARTSGYTFAGITRHYSEERILLSIYNERRYKAASEI